MNPGTTGTMHVVGALALKFTDIRERIKNDIQTRLTFLFIPY
jgi:hypothetical protein